jgi:hypothetical protein
MVHEPPVMAWTREHRTAPAGTVNGHPTGDLTELTNRERVRGLSADSPRTQ